MYGFSKHFLSYKLCPDNYEQNKRKSFKSVDPFRSLPQTKKNNLILYIIYVPIIDLRFG